MAANSVEKSFFTVSNVQLKVKIRFKTFEKSYILFHLAQDRQHGLLCSKIFTYSSNKRVIYKPDLNL